MMTITFLSHPAYPTTFHYLHNTSQPFSSRRVDYKMWLNAQQYNYTDLHQSSGCIKFATKALSDKSLIISLALQIDNSRWSTRSPQWDVVAQASEFSTLLYTLSKSLERRNYIWNLTQLQTKPRLYSIFPTHGQDTVHSSIGLASHPIIIVIVYMVAAPSNTLDKEM